MADQPSVRRVFEGFLVLVIVGCVIGIPITGLQTWKDNRGGSSTSSSASPPHSRDWVDPSFPPDAIAREPATGEPAPAMGTEAFEDMERREVECFDSGRTDCADHPSDYLDDPDSYPLGPP